MSQLDTSSLLSTCFIAALSILTYFFQSEVLDFLRLILEKKYLKSILIITVSIIVVSHSIRISPDNDSAGVMIRSGLVPLDLFLTLGTYIAITTTACSLLEGAFIQQFFSDVEYFTKFRDLDIYVLLGVSALLLWYVVFHMYKMGLELFFKRENISKSTQEQHNKSNQSEDQKARAPF